MTSDKYIHYDEDGWYFEDETYDLHGPYLTKEIAKGKFREYCDYLNGVYDNDPSRT